MKPRWPDRLRATAVLLVAAGLAMPVGAQSSREAISKREAQKTYSMTLEAERQSLTCFPSTSVEYQQSNTLAQVTGVISVDDCAAASGTYRVSLVVRGNDGSSETLQFEESWARDDAAPIQIEKDYAIGENVDLLRVRVRSKRCVCAEPASDTEDDVGGEQ